MVDNVVIVIDKLWISGPPRSTVFFGIQRKGEGISKSLNSNMEKVYDSNGFRATENIDFAKYFKNYREICSLAENSPFKNFINLTKDINPEEMQVYFKDIEAICNPSTLMLEDEVSSLPMQIPSKLWTKTKFDTFYPVNSQAKNLNVIRAKEALEMRWATQEYKFTGKRYIKSSIGKQVKTENKNIMEPGSDYVLSILVYKPCSIHHGQRNSGEKLRFAYEIKALGSNLISQVVDIIECMSNSAIIKEVQNTNIDLAQFQNARKWYPSQTVFIDGVFYNDTRSPECKDLSLEIIKWAKEKNFGKFTTAKMEESVLSSLTPRLGFPYVYIHQADCEHIFVFSDVHLVQNSDCLDAKEYPKIVSFNRPSNMMCLLCSIRICQWVVSKCEKFPQERVYLCTECCNSYLFLDGEKVTDFKLYPYFDQKKL